MNKQDLAIGKLYEVILEGRRRLLVTKNGNVLERLNSQDTFVLLKVSDNPYQSEYDDLVILEVLAASGNVGSVAIYLEEIKMVN